MDEITLVTGATGKQGGAVADAMLARGQRVRALVRDASTARAHLLARQGAEIVVGDLDDPATIHAAMAGVMRLFSVQTMTPGDPAGEVRHAENVMSAARAAGIRHIVHTSVSAVAGFSTDIDRVGESMVAYHANKLAAEAYARQAGAALTIIRPGIFMENVLRPSMYFRDDETMVLALDPDVPVAFVAVHDVGVAAATAFMQAERFDGVELELAGQMISFRDVAALVSRVTGRRIRVETDDGRGLVPAPMAAAQRLITSDPSPAHPRFAHTLRIPLTSFAEWAAAHKESL
jgi:uncharacterized protein YbjT (DUF2867 family)